jgi:hypothetical protein
MGLIYDNPDLAALTLTRLAAEESEGPGTLEGRMLDYLDGLEQRVAVVGMPAARNVKQVPAAAQA